MRFVLMGRHDDGVWFPHLGRQQERRLGPVGIRDLPISAREFLKKNSAREFLNNNKKKKARDVLHL
jgi:hypothetical protein